VSPLASQTLAVVLAGGNGSRLGDLTQTHAKPALPFAGQYRNIDFTLSNCINSGIRRVAVLTQYKAHTLIQHIRHGWSFLPAETGEFVEIWPAQQRRGDSWYGGTADAVFQNLDLIETHAPDLVLILAGDHIYKMNYGRMLEAHVASGATATVACVEVPLSEASAFGIVAAAPQGRITHFDEKPGQPRPMPGNPECALASMGIYAFERRSLFDCLARDSADPSSRHDFGRDIMPRLLDDGAHLHAHVFREGPAGRKPYWRDVGTLQSYWKAHMDLLVDEPVMDIYDDSWPIRTDRSQRPPPRFFGQGSACQSIVAGGSVVGGRVEHSVLSTNCRVEPGALVESSVLLPNVEVARGCRITNALVGPDCRIPAGTVIGQSPRIGLDFDQSWHAGVTLVTRESIARAAARSFVGTPVLPSILLAGREGADPLRNGMRVVR
jgi:glucose-1-phosphate adenylyltransferase